MRQRQIALEGCFNFRDMGGFETQQGKTVRWGRLFRADALSALTEKDLAILQDIGIRTVVDFRTPEEIQSHPDRLPQGARLVVLSPSAAVAAQASASISGQDKARVDWLVEKATTPEGRSWFAKNMDTMEGQMRKFVTDPLASGAFGRFLNLIAEPYVDPLVFHCKGGKDRTGWAATILLLVLGVSRADIIRDYMETAQYNLERNANRMEEYRRYTTDPHVLGFLSSLMQVKEQYLTAALEELDNQGEFEHYLATTLGVSAQTQQQLRDKYLE